MQDKYTPAEVERAAHSHWTAIDAYRVTENARNAQGELKKKF